MKCPFCDSENRIGATYCAGCGAKLELSDVQAQAQATAEVTHENWQKAYRMMNRTLFFVALFLLAAILFRAYATRRVIAEFGATAPLPAPRVLITPGFSELPALPAPAAAPSSAITADRNSEADILTELAATARDRMNVNVRLKTGGVVKGVLLSRTPDEIRVVTDWGPPIAIRSVKTADVDLATSQLPE